MPWERRGGGHNYATDFAGVEVHIWRGDFWRMKADGLILTCNLRAPLQDLDAAQKEAEIRLMKRILEISQAVHDSR